jgi:hypothetical protein
VRTVVGDLLPLAVGIAISPLPVIAAVLILLSDRARSSGLAFLAGWLGGIAVATLLSVLLAANVTGDDAGGTHPVRGVVLVALGMALLFLAVRTARADSSGRDATPRWMAAVTTATPRQAWWTAVFLSAGNAKNLALCVTAGVKLGSASLTTLERGLTLLVFAVVSAASVAVPVLAYLARPQTMAASLDRLRGWLVSNNATIMLVLLVVLGVVTIGNGIKSF